jgi:uncharacterized protein (TIRG00374 family)
MDVTEETGQDAPRKDGSAEPKGDAARRYGRNIFIAIIIGLAINILLGLFVDFDKVKTTLAQAQAWQILLPFAAIVAVYLIDAVRFQIVFWQFGVRLSFGDALYNNVIGYFFSSITPSSAGGYPMQIYHFAKLGLDTTVSTNVTFSRLMVSNFVQLLILVLFVREGIGLLSLSGNGAYILGLGMVTTLVASIFLLFVFFKPTLIGRLALRLEGSGLGRFIGRLSKNERWAESLSAWSFGLRDSFRFLWRKKILAVLIDSLLFILVEVVWALGLYYPLASLSGVTLRFDDFLFAFIVCGLVSAYIPTPGSSGSVEAAYALVLGGLTGGFGAALTAVFLWRLGAYYLHLVVGGLTYAFVPVRKGSYAASADGTVRRRKPAEPAPIGS